MSSGFKERLQSITAQSQHSMYSMHNIFNEVSVIQNSLGIIIESHMEDRKFMLYSKNCLFL